MKILWILPLFLVLSCGETTTTETSDIDIDTTTRLPDTQASDTNSSTAELDGCYWEIKNRDTLVIHLTQNGNAVSGKLSFDNYQKDGSTGKITGTVDGEIIHAWYDFESEGMRSVMEIYLKKSDDVLQRGNGEISVKGDTAYFADAANIRYGEDVNYKKIACTEVPEKYKL